MNRVWLVMLLGGLMWLAVPALALAQAAAEVVKEEGKPAGQAVYVMNSPPSIIAWLGAAFLLVTVLLLAMVASQLAGIKTAIEKSNGGKSSAP